MNASTKAAIPEAWLTIRSARTIRRARSALIVAGALGVLVIAAQLLDRLPLMLGLSVALAFVYMLAAAALGTFDQLLVGRLNREGDAVAAALVAGDVAGAETRLVALLRRSRRLAGFHATWVAMIGVCRHLDGDTAQGLALVTQALGSGHFDAPEATALRDSLRAWRVLMLLGVGDDAGIAHELAQGGIAPSVRLAVEAHAGRWQAVIDFARAHLDDAEISLDHRSASALLGAHAARQLRDPSLASFEAFLQATPPSPLTQITPAYRRFLPPRADGAG